ncbi:MAG: hypothetical protein KIT13_02420 [Burkholderiales bacterium]|nr:hypothetical protein [Burkholderiales bacterium]MCW5604176.1 hypothetical protein [Burkholderiales bacterium]
MHTAPRSVADIEAFVALLKAACSDDRINATLRRLLEMPDDRRRGVVHAWVTDLLRGRVAGIHAGRGLPDGRCDRRTRL